MEARHSSIAARIAPWGSVIMYIHSCYDHSRIVMPRAASNPPSVAALGARQGAAWPQVGFTLDLRRLFYNNVRVREHSRSTRARPKSIYHIIIIIMCVALCVALCAVICVVDAPQTPCGRAFRCVVGCVVSCAVGCAVTVLQRSDARASAGARLGRQRCARLWRHQRGGLAGWRRRPGGLAASTARRQGVGRAFGHRQPLALGPSSGRQPL